MTHSKLVQTLFSNANKSGLRYCHWKSIDHLKQSYEGVTDLDVLVARGDTHSFKQIASELNFIECLTPALRSYPGVQDYVAYDKTMDKFIHLHLHSQLILGDRWVKGYRLPLEEHILSNRIWDEEFLTYIVSPKDEFDLCAIRMCLKYNNPFYRQRVKLELADIRKRISSHAALGSISFGGSFDVILSDLFQSLLDENYTLSNFYAKKVRRSFRSFYRYSIVHFTVINSVRFSYRVVIEFLRRKLNIFDFGRRRIMNGGLTIALVGIDGAGKTSLIERNTKFFSQQFDISTIFMGGGKSGASYLRRVLFCIHDILNVFRLQKKYTVLNLDGPPIDKQISFPRGFFHLILSLDRLRRVKRMMRSRANGRLVFVDRWPQNEICGNLDGKKLTRWATSNNLLKRLFFKLEDRAFDLCQTLKPDIIVIMNVSPHVAHNRKSNDITLSTAHHLSQTIKRLRFHNIQVFEINADLEIDDVDIAFRDLVFRNLASGG